MKSTRQYELTVLFAPDLAPDQQKTTQDWVSTFIKEKGGEVEQVDVWGKKPLAYKIRKFEDAVYVLYTFSVDPSAIKDLDTAVQQKEGVIRHLLVNILDR